MNTTGPGAGIVLVFGTFDLLHPGHLHFFSQAKKLGQSLVVVVGTDANVTRIKGSAPSESQEARMTAIRKTHLVDKVLLAPEDYNYIALLKREVPAVIALGYDQKPSLRELKKELSANQLSIRVVRLKPFKSGHFKSSILRGMNTSDRSSG